jgi:hypothetical protein
MNKEGLEQRKYYCRQMLKMAEADLETLKIESSLIKEQSNDMELGKTVRALWNKKEIEIKKRIDWLKSQLEENE